jgi:hypothetical protein
MSEKHQNAVRLRFLSIRLDMEQLELIISPHDVSETQISTQSGQQCFDVLGPSPSAADLLCAKTTKSSHDVACSSVGGDSYTNLASATLGGLGGHTTFEAMLG